MHIRKRMVINNLHPAGKNFQFPPDRLPPRPLQCHVIIIEKLQTLIPRPLRRDRGDNRREKYEQQRQVKDR